MQGILLLVLFLISVLMQNVYSILIYKYTVDQSISDNWKIRNNYNVERLKTGQDPLK